jgi:hypothetical protein
MLQAEESDDDDHIDPLPFPDRETELADDEYEVVYADGRAPEVRKFERPINMRTLETNIEQHP